MSTTNSTTTAAQPLFEDHEGMNRNTDLCVNLKTFLLHDRVAQTGKGYDGTLTRDEEEHFTFVEASIKAVATKVKRNPPVYQGQYINVNRASDGTCRPFFKRVCLNLVSDIEALANAIAEELVEAYQGLGQKSKD